MLIQEIDTTLPGAEVLDRAAAFFQATAHNSTAVERRTERYVRFRADVGTVLVAVLPGPGGVTRVRATAARQWGLVGRFLASLGPPNGVRALQARKRARRSYDNPAELTVPRQRHLAAA